MFQKIYSITVEYNQFIEFSSFFNSLQQTVQAIQRLGAVVQFCDGQNFNTRERKAEQIGRERGLVYINSCDDRDVLAGIATLGVEFLRCVPDLDAVLVPVGGGSLAAGMVLAAAKLSPNCKIIGVEPTGKNLALCLKTGTRLWPNPPEYLKTKAEGLKRQQTGLLTFQVLCKKADRLVSKLFF